MTHYRDKKGRVYLIKYDPEKRRGVTLPRDESRFMDAWPDEQIRAWIEIARKEEKPDTPKLFEGAKVRKWFYEWVAFVESRGKDKQTVNYHVSRIERFIFPFFANVAKCEDPNGWQKHAARFNHWLASRAVEGDGQKRGATASQIHGINSTLRQFYRWLKEEGHVSAPDLVLRAPVKSESAKLPRPLSPEEVLEWARNCPHDYIKFCGLMGYFFSLRPQELFALRPMDFRMGDSISALECIQVMGKASLYNRFAVHVARQKQNIGTVVQRAKSGSKGWVACFNRDAAVMVAEILTQTAPEKSVVQWNNSKVYVDWKKYGMPGVSLKDMRRGSLYYLGHYSNLQPMQLMKHARHKNIETTMLYCRRPDEYVAHAAPVFDLNAL